MVEILVKLKPLFNQYYEKAKKDPKIWIGLVILLAAISLIWLPYWRVSQFGINNATENATLENQYRATIAQILGGIAIGIGLYYTWRRVTIAENDLKVSQEGQITERFTRAIDQLGKRALEIRLGGIYALERISIESDKDYWPIIEILTAYVRKNSSVEVTGNKRVTNLAMDIQANESTTNKIPDKINISLDIQAILTVLRRRKYSFNDKETKCLNLQMTCLQEAYLAGTDLIGANLEGTNLAGADLAGADLTKANLTKANLAEADLTEANLEMTGLREANLERADLIEANLEWANLERANLTKAKE